MTRQLTPLQRRLRTAGLLVMIGVFLGGLTLLWTHPVAFMVFLGISVVSIAGVCYALWAVINDTD